MGYSKKDQFYFLSFAEQKAATVVYKAFHVNKYELVLLAGLSCFLQIHGRKSVGRENLFKWLGYNRNYKYKSGGYMAGLMTKGCIHNLAYKARKGNSYAITPYGGQILDRYYLEVQKVDLKNKGRKSLPGIDSHIIQTIDIPEKLPAYILITAGRDT